MKYILGIETSCDDTSICLLKGKVDFYKKDQPFPELLSFLSFSSEEILKRWGGVVPEIAARNHLFKLRPLLEESFQKANISIADIDLISVTTHPGLLGPLLTGLNAAKTLSLLSQCPILPTNHLMAHMHAIHIDQKVPFPFMGVLVSGGHSLFLYFKEKDEFEIIGSTIDDAAGEAFDKGGKLLGLPYPAGKIIDDMAKDGDSKKFSFPIGLDDKNNPNLSYSGLKTSLRVFLEKNQIDSTSKDFKDLCASYQDAIIEALRKKLKTSLKIVKNKFGAQDLPIIVGGGVACNTHLRNIFSKNFQNVHFVSPKYCTDNGAMVASYGLMHFEKAISFPDCLKLDAKSRFISKKDQQIVS